MDIGRSSILPVYQLAIIELTDSIFKVIEKNTHVRIKIVGTRVDATEIVSLSIDVASKPALTPHLPVCHWDDQRGPSGRY